ncbi:MAG: tetratricopeptide repeat protein [Chitinophagaceae bacterium]
MKITFLHFGLIVFFLMLMQQITAQPGTTIELTKPAKYENRKLPAEKTGNKKFTVTRRLYQDMVTHYNYYFNANNKLNDIVNNARLSFKDDYTQLLPFYNYSLDVTASATTDLDSIIYKCAEGVLLHDLRNDWIDDMYFLLGKAYFFRKNFDSAQHCFQYVNYAFAPKDEGYDIPIGSNVSNNTGVFSVATVEKEDILKKITSKPPSRNEALLWLSRNFIETDNLNEAASLLEVIRHDPNFPERLQTDLHEMLAYLFYKENIYDSSAFYLSKSLANAQNKLGESRWEYLTAQMYQRSNDTAKAIKYYNRSIDHTPDPIMEVYAYLSIINLSDGNKENILQQKLNSLLKLAKRDKYIQYRDIIYYAAAQVEMQLNDKKSAVQILQKSIKYSENNPQQKNLSFLLLADITYDNMQYLSAHNYYDSVQVDQISDSVTRVRAQARQSALKDIADNLNAIHLEDSLQHIAAMSETERKVFLEKLAKQLLKQQQQQQNNQQEMNDAENVSNNNPTSANMSSRDMLTQNNPANTSLPGNQTQPLSSFPQSNQIPPVNAFPQGNQIPPVNAFPQGNQTPPGNSFPQNNQIPPANAFNSGGTSTGAWYFNNTSLISGGFTMFKQRWGNRPNVDDWQRKSAIAQTANANATANEDSTGGASSTITADMDKASAYDQLLSKIPLSPDKIKTSNDNIIQALFGNGKVFENELENYEAAIDSYNEINQRFGKTDVAEETLFNLYYCYAKNGNKKSADSCRNILMTEYAKGKYAQMLNNPQNISPTSNANPATKEYDRIYNLFIEGNFDEAKTAKAKADSIYGNTYWTPQLLYIEAIYYVSKKEDSAAINRLNNLTSLYPNSPLAERAATMIDVLRRRKEIETYLTNLQIKRNEDEAGPVVTLTTIAPAEQKKPEIRNDSVTSANKNEKPQIKHDTTTVAPTLKSFSFKADDPQYVLIVLDKVDPVYANETKNAFYRFNLANYYNQKINITGIKLDDRYNLVMIGPFTNALAATQYVDKTKPITAGRILPWLTPDKYIYSIISESNLDVLKDNKDIEGYKKLLHSVLPDEF